MWGKGKELESRVIQPNYYAQTVVMQHHTSGITLMRTGFTDGDEGSASFIHPVDLYLDDDSAKKLRDVLNGWYPQTTNELVVSLVGRADVVTDYMIPPDGCYAINTPDIKRTDEGPCRVLIVID